MAGLVASKFFCLHGGLSPNVKSLDHVKMIDRNHEIPHEGIMCDLLWSDPEEIDGYNPSPRGAGFIFGKDVSNKFCHNNDLKMIARAHQCINSGYQFCHNEKVCTVFSAPNYCYRCANDAAIMEVDEHLNTALYSFDPAPRRGLVQTFTRTPDYFL